MAEQFDAYHKWLGIPPDEQPPNHYRLLGLVDFEADADVIEAAANQRMTYVRECAIGPHVDLSQQILNHIASARIELLQPETKAKYDAGLRKAAASDDIEEQDAANLGTVTEFPMPERRRVRRRGRQPALTRSWHLPVYGVATLVMLLVGVLLTDVVSSRMLAVVPLETRGGLEISPVGTLELRPETDTSDGDPPVEIGPNDATASDGTSGSLTTVEIEGGDDSLPDLPVSDGDGGNGVADVDVSQPGVTPSTPSGSDLPDIGGAPQRPTAEVDGGAKIRHPIATKQQLREAKQKLDAKDPPPLKEDEEFRIGVLLSEYELYQGDAPTQYFILQEVLALALKRADIISAEKAVKLLEENYQVDGPKVRAEMVIAMSKRIKPQADMYEYFWEQAALLIDKMFKQDELQIALDLSEAIYEMGTEHRRRSVQVEIEKRRHQIEIARAYAQKLPQWRKALAEDANDANANLLLGLYLYFVQGNHAAGLPHLRLGSDAKIAAAAELESSAGRGLDDLVEIGKAWRLAGRKIRGKAKDYQVDINTRGRHFLIDAYVKATDEKRAAIEQTLIDERLLIINALQMRLIYCPPGEFLMGSPESEAGREVFQIRIVNNVLTPVSERQHRVRLTRGFYIGTHEVTQGQFERALAANPSEKIGENLPVHNVTTMDARQFCAALKNREGRNYRLPTEAEWEYACRAGTTSAYAFGDVLKQSQATFGLPKGAEDTGPGPVGSYQPNAWGLYDMHGNVYEWVRDYHRDGYYAEFADNNKVAVDPIGPRSSGMRILRGGGCDNIAAFCRSAARALFSGRKAGPRDVPLNTGRFRPWTGFRVVLPE
ncbi:MAG: hypothetical protein DWQ42_06725 [Planctomycetota bacterium]|nr:MAG: hypothetical protein DWQ42_06725 [Planctomycetota bacterium]REK38506.1 MAG: hypothetical protein DWQ46_20460 [Planctomycetota bacterium]